jgi:hypothetical protein
VAVFAGHVMYEEMCLAKNDAFKCQHCSESCASPRLLEVHAKEKHPDVEYHELFSCEKCGDEGFASFQSYVLHRRETLPQHAFSVDKGGNSFACFSYYKSTTHIIQEITIVCKDYILYAVCTSHSLCWWIVSQNRGQLGF